MKKLHKVILSATIGILVAVFTAKTVAADQHHPFANQTDCMRLYNDAKLVMETRQMGMSLPEMMSAVGNWKAGKYMVSEAFKRSQYQTPSFQTRAAKEFAETQYNKCIQVNSI